MFSTQIVETKTVKKWDVKTFGGKDAHCKALIEANTHSYIREILGGTQLGVPKVLKVQENKIFFEKINGFPLSCLIQKSMIDKETFELIKALVLTSIKEVHRHGLSHGDLRQSNVVYDLYEQKCWLINVGLADVNPSYDLDELSRWKYTTL